MKKALTVILFGGILVLLGITIFFPTLPLALFALIQDIDALTNFVNQFGIWAPIVYGIIYCIGAVVGAPSSLLTIAAGLLFGLWNGLIVVVISATIAAGISFFIARQFEEYFTNFLRKNAPSVLKHLEKAATENGFKIILFARLFFLPYAPVNYASGVVKGLKFKDYIVATFLTNILGSFAFLFLGSSITQNWWIFLLGVGLLILTLQIPKIAKKIQSKRKK